MLKVIQWTLISRTTYFSITDWTCSNKIRLILSRNSRRTVEICPKNLHKRSIEIGLVNYSIVIQIKDALPMLCTRGRLYLCSAMRCIGWLDLCISDVHAKRTGYNETLGNHLTCSAIKNTANLFVGVHWNLVSRWKRLPTPGLCDAQTNETLHS